MKVVLHICCGVCAAGVIDRLRSEGNEVLGLYFNPNIHPKEEYEKRLEAAYTVSKELNFPLTAAPYTPEDWFAETKGLESELEGGKRCEICFRMRLLTTFSYIAKLGGDAFTTTLTVGPRKSAAVINRIGYEIGGDKFLTRDFKKKAGFQQATALAKKWGLYRQNYCGCRYSLEERNALTEKGEGIRKH